jgi:glycosyltransferase involved in cell wall biosynthesis
MVVVGEGYGEVEGLGLISLEGFAAGLAMNSTRRIYLDVAGRMHSLYKTLITYPPAGYEFMAPRAGWDRVSGAAASIGFVYSLQERLLNRIVPLNLVKARLERFKKLPEGTDLTYATGHLVFREEPWVVDLEFVTQLAGYSVRHFKKHRRLIQRVLSSDNCKRIICWTEAARKTVLANMDCQGFDHKVEVVPLAVPRKDFTKNHAASEKVRLLFVGSANIPGEFEYKGGNEVLEAFIHLREKYPDVELVIRSDVPGHIRQQYRGTDNLRLIDGIIPWEQLDEEFKSADIFLFPSHSTPGLAFLDAMSYELPVVTTDVWANPEMVIDGKTGFIIKKSGNVQYYADDFIPIWNYIPSSTFMRSIRTVDSRVVQELVEKTSVLIENGDLRKMMGKAGRHEIESGKFSIESRREKLKKIFDEAITGS